MNAITALRPVDGAGTWTHTARHTRTHLTLLGTVVVCFVFVALFVGAVALGHKAVCAADMAATGKVAHSYCPGFHGGAR